MSLEWIPEGQDAQDVQAGDVIFCHRLGFVSRMIRFFDPGDFSHAGGIDLPLRTDTEPMLVEALTKCVERNPLSKYRHTRYAIARNHLVPRDQRQASTFLRSCVGQEYGWATIFLIAVHRCRHPKGKLNGTEICSGMVAQMLCRADANFDRSPAQMTPNGLAAYLKNY